MSCFFILAGSTRPFLQFTSYSKCYKTINLSSI